MKTVLFDLCDREKKLTEFQAKGGFQWPAEHQILTRDIQLVRAQKARQEVLVDEGIKKEIKSYKEANPVVKQTSQRLNQERKLGEGISAFAGAFIDDRPLRQGAFLSILFGEEDYCQKMLL